VDVKTDVTGDRRIAVDDEDEKQRAQLVIISDVVSDNHDDYF